MGWKTAEQKPMTGLYMVEDDYDDMVAEADQLWLRNDWEPDNYAEDIEDQLAGLVQRRVL